MNYFPKGFHNCIAVVLALLDYVVFAANRSVGNRCVDYRRKLSTRSFSYASVCNVHDRFSLTFVVEVDGIDRIRWFKVLRGNELFMAL